MLSHVRYVPKKLSENRCNSMQSAHTLMEPFYTGDRHRGQTRRVLCHLSLLKADLRPPPHQTMSYGSLGRFPSSTIRLADCSERALVYLRAIYCRLQTFAWHHVHLEKSLTLSKVEGSYLALNAGVCPDLWFRLEP